MKRRRLSMSRRNIRRRARRAERELRRLEPFLTFILRAKDRRRAIDRKRKATR
jgi:hypothetical protein